MSEKTPLQPFTAKQLIAYLRDGHEGHDMIPDTDLIMCIAQARGVPQIAVNRVKDMRTAGMALTNIYKSLKVIALACNNCVAENAIRSITGRKLGLVRETSQTWAE